MSVQRTSILMRNRGREVLVFAAVRWPETSEKVIKQDKFHMALEKRNVLIIQLQFKKETCYLINELDISGFTPKQRDFLILRRTKKA